MGKKAKKAKKKKVNKPKRVSRGISQATLDQREGRREGGSNDGSE